MMLMTTISPNRIVAVTLFALITTFIPSAHAQYVWNMDTAASSSGSIINLTPSNISQGNNNGTTPLLTVTNPSSGYAGASGGNNAGAAAAIPLAPGFSSANTYFGVTLTPSGNLSVKFTGISFGSRSSSTGPQSFSIRTSADNYATEAAGAVLPGSNDSTWRVINATPQPNVTGAPGTALAIRIYGYDGTGNVTPDIANWRIDDLTISAIAAPEPATLSLLALGSLGILARRRKK